MGPIAEGLQVRRKLGEGCGGDCHASRDDMEAQPLAPCEKRRATSEHQRSEHRLSTKLACSVAEQALRFLELLHASGKMGIDNLSPRCLGLFAGAFAAATFVIQAWEPMPIEPPSQQSMPRTFLDHFFYSPAESDFDSAWVLPWMSQWRVLAGVLATAYLLLLRWVALSRLFYPLPRVRTAWNAFLAAFSAVALSRVLPPLLLRISTHGFVATLCAPPQFGLGNGASGLWLWLFVLSKAAELLDTAFLAIQRSPLSLLHIWHHSSVLIWSWHQYVSRSGPSVFFSAINLAVHSAMYTYFMLIEYVADDALQYFAMWITCAQTSQMLAGAALTLIAAVYAGGSEDGVSSFGWDSVVLSLIIFVTNFLNFVRFADQRYGLRMRLTMAVAKMRLGGQEADEDLAVRPWRGAALDVKAQFLEACQAAPLFLSAFLPEDPYNLYGLYKQTYFHDAPKGDSDYPPGSKALRKRQAWQQQEGRSAEDCMTQYVNCIDAAATRQAEALAAQPRRKQKQQQRLKVPQALPTHGGDVLYSVRIIGVGRYLPKRVIANEEIERRGGFPQGMVAKSRVGVKERRRAASGETASSMAAKAAQEAIQHAGIEAGELDAIINASGTLQQMIPDGGCLLQYELGLSDSGIPSFSVHATCLSFLVALETACAMISRPDGRYRTVLVSSTEVTSAGVDPFDANTAPLFGDGAAAAIVRRAEPSEGSCIHQSLVQTFSEGHDLCAVRGYGTGLPNWPRDDTMDHKSPNSDLTYGHCHFDMDGEKVLRFVGSNLPPLLEELQPGLSRRLGDIKWVVPHQASGLALEHLAAFGWPQARVLRTIEEVGNCVAASIPITLYEGVTDGRIQRGDKVLICGTSAGISFGGMILTF